MAYVVSPWLWRVALRDHGPQSPSVLLTLHTIGTYMNRDGFAYPGQLQIAHGMRASVKTVQRNIARARSEGWLWVESAGRGGQGWRHYVYRAAVPDEVMCTLNPNLNAEYLSDELASRHGGLEGDDTIVSPRTGERGDTMMSPRSHNDADGECQRGDIRNANVETSGLEGGDTDVVKVATQLCRTNSRSETPALRTHASEEAPSARERAVRAAIGDSAEVWTQAEADRIAHKIEKLVRQAPEGFSDYDIARTIGQSIDVVRTVRERLERNS